MIWPFGKPRRKTDAEIEDDQRRSDRAKRDFDEMQRRLEAAVNGLMAPKIKANGDD